MAADISNTDIKTKTWNINYLNSIRNLARKHCLLKNLLIKVNPSVTNLSKELEKVIAKKFDNLESTISTIVEKNLEDKQIANSEQV